MQRVIRQLGLGAAALVALGACGGDGSNAPDPGSAGGNGTFTAVIDGQAWAASNNSGQAATVPSVPGGFVITGTEVVSATDGITIGISLDNITGPGTYALGVLPMVYGGIATIGSAAGAWLTALDGAAGTITITALTATRIAGTFSFTAQPGAGNSGAARVVTQGKFDLPLNSGGSLPAVPDNAGSRATGTFGGTAYNASTIAVVQSGSTGFAFSSTNGIRTFTVELDGVTAPGTYPISLTAPLHLVSVSNATGPSPRPVWGTDATTAGTVTITSITATRVKGSVSASLGPQSGTSASGALTVTADFDIGLP